MGYVLAFGSCARCNKMFGFNPNKVPSVRINDKKEPVCQECIEWANPKRKEMGYPEFTIPKGAYEPTDENGL